jgi:DNA-binding transcriptional MerR regulator
MYTIGQVSQMFDLPVSTLRYYDKMGLFPGLARTSGTRRFNEEQLEALRVIECLKRSGLEIRDIKKFMDWCQEGPSTYADRLELFREQRREVDEKIAELERTRAMLSWKCWYYGKACEQGNEDFAANLPEGLPEDARRLWDASHDETVKTA